MALTWTHKDRGEIRVHENTEELSTGVVDIIAEISEASILKHDWDKWYVFWAEERGVKSLDDSNYKLARDHLLSRQSCNRAEFSIRRMVKKRTVTPSENSECPKDGQIASLFPNHPALEVKDDWVTYLTNSPKPPPERITFTLPVINSAANVAIVATGASKSNAIHLAIDDLPLQDSSLSLPARLVQPSNRNLVWFMDKPAGSKLEGFKSLRIEFRPSSCSKS
ncbi:LOW QUALITY PROTEIN: hypothetical protein HID58_064771 [Brassica napus]|uniref:Glucosamine/galactosamine-6-phosphate isomerase domain-containing protein n=1 Tax=Brassica napus TaxID=3708 RepID=A0ABQ7ZAY2_BRANA|nr:LOW QUALITY PROTEIN: hypothetical protein HID58_064771 [Brassica napus]